MPITLRHYLRDMGQARLVSVDRMDADIWNERASHDFVAAMFSAFAMLAIGLAALGIYGIVSHSVAERKRELGSVSRWARRRVTSCTPSFVRATRWRSAASHSGSC